MAGNTNLSLLHSPSLTQCRHAHAHDARYSAFLRHSVSSPRLDEAERRASSTAWMRLLSLIDRSNASAHHRPRKVAAQLGPQRAVKGEFMPPTERHQRIRASDIPPTHPGIRLSYVDNSQALTTRLAVAWCRLAEPHFRWTYTPGAACTQFPTPVRSVEPLSPHAQLWLAQSLFFDP